MPTYSSYQRVFTKCPNISHEGSDLLRSLEHILMLRTVQYVRKPFRIAGAAQKCDTTARSARTETLATSLPIATPLTFWCFRYPW